MDSLWEIPVKIWMTFNTGFFLWMSSQRLSHKTIPIKFPLCTDSSESLFTLLISLLKFLPTFPGLLYSFKFLPSNSNSSSVSFDKLSLSFTEHSKFTSHANSCLWLMLPPIQSLQYTPVYFWLIFSWLGYLHIKSIAYWSQGLCLIYHSIPHNFWKRELNKVVW